MSEVNNVKEEHSEQKESESVHLDPKVKEAEIKLKEMSRRAKQKKTAQVRTRVKNNTKYLWYILGGVGVLSGAYILLKSRGNKRPVYKFVRSDTAHSEWAKAPDRRETERSERAKAPVRRKPEVSVPEKPLPEGNLKCPSFRPNCCSINKYVYTTDGIY